LAPVDAATLRSLVQALLERHDSLRLRFRRCAQGWLQSYSSAAEIEVEQPLSEAESAAELADRLNASLSLEEGPLFRCALLATASEPAVLLLVAHHLVIDGISWRVLLDDLGELINAARAGRRAHLGRPTASYRQWVERQIALTESRAPREHLPFWLEQASSSARPLFALLPGHQQGSTRREQIKGCKLGPEIAAALSGRLEQQAATTEELLLTGLVLAVSEVFGRRDVVVLKESHGRDAFADLDLSASVGWFTAACPLRLRLPRSGGLKAQIEAVMRQWRMSRGREMSYGILRYLDPDPHVRRSLAEQAPPDVAFNYFGQMGQAQTFGPLRLVQGYSGAVRGPLDSAACPLELNVMLRDGWLEYYWTYDTHRVPEEPLSRLAESFASHLQVVARLFGALAATLEEPDALELSAASTQLIQAAIEELDL
jgi:non-ribosomal peptide synthase protein (TIGR01720 family)